MTPIRTRSRLLELAAANAPTAACAAIIRVEGASVFRARNGAGDVGFIVLVSSMAYPRSWFIAFWCDEQGRRWRCEFLTKLPEGAVELKGERL